MDATLTIQVRVLGAQAQQQVRQLQQQINAMNASSGAAAGSSVAQAGVLGRAWTNMAQTVGGAWAGLRAAWADGTNNFKRTITTLGNAGQSLRRSGQQIAFGFTLPLTIAGAAVVGWAMDNERAMTQVRKVYGDYTYTSERVRKETDALGKTFGLLSSIFGVHQDEVIGIAGEWAATGLAGEDLARATRATMEAMMLGDLDPERATKSLISIMATWRTSLDDMGGGFSELTDAMAILNSVENQTGARFADLVEAFDRAGGAARQAGMSMQELSALVASLVPATGSGAAAGNAIKTMVSRIMAPTQETLDVLNAIGINTSDPKWMSATATQKIERMATEFENLDQATKNVVTSTVAGRWQLNRFEVMMSDIASGTGMYAKGMDAASNATRRQGDYLKELDAIMESNPKKMDILVNVLRNELTTAAIQFIPIILGVIGALGKLAMAFNNLSPQTKSWIVAIITLVAVLGPVLMLLGVFTTTLKFVFEALGFGLGVLKVAGFLIGTFVNILLWAAAALPIFGQAFMGMARTVAIALLAPTGALRVFASKVWVELTWAAAGFKTFIMTTIPRFVSQLWVEMGWAAASLKTFASQVWVELTWAAAGLRTFLLVSIPSFVSKLWVEMGWAAASLKVFAGKVWVEMTWAAAGFASFASKVWVELTWAAAAIKGFSITTFASQVWTELTWAAAGFASFAAKVWVEITWAAAALQGWIASLVVWFSGTTLATQGVAAAFATLASQIWVEMTWAYAAIAGLPAAVASAFATVGAIIATALGIPIAAGIAIAVGAFVAVVAFVVALFNDDFRNGVINALKAVGRGIWGLPKVFAAALGALLRIVAKIVTKIMDWLSYLNPFQRHSPSLVDNVKAGVATILDEYSRLRGISAVVRSAAAAHQAFQNAIAGAQGAMDAQETAEQRAVIAKQAPGAVGAFDNMVSQRSMLQGQLPAIAQEIGAQAEVVAKLEAKYKVLDRQVTASERVLAGLERRLEAVNATIQKSEDAIDKYASTGITGMRAMSDAIFENSMAQKRLQLAIMDLEDAGGTVDDLKARMAALNGEMELLTGTRQGLYLAGAGSDILSTYDAQIAAVREQQAGISDNVTELERMNTELEKLQRTGQRLDLENSINFDPQLRQIEQMVSGLNELPFEEIIANITIEQQKIAALTPLQASLNAKVDAQKVSLAAITLQRDLIKQQLDDEQAKLTELEQAYSDIEALINDMTSSMSEFASASKSAQDALSGEAGPLDGIAGDYEIPTGTGTFDTESSLAGIEAMNAELEKELAGIMDDMPDPFAMIKDKWKSFTGWFQASFIGDFAGWMGRNFSFEGLGNAFGDIGGFFARNFSLEGLKNIGKEILGFFINTGKTLLNIILWPFKAAINLLRPIWEPLLSVVRTVIGAIVGAFTWLWGIVQPILMAIWNFFYTYIFPVFQFFWALVQIVFTLMVKFIELNVKIIVGIIMAIWWVITHVGDIISWLWTNIVSPVFRFIAAIAVWLWQNVLRPVFDAIMWVIKNVLGPVFSWLWEKIIKPVFGFIGDKAKTVWEKFLKPVFEAIRNFINDNLIPAWNMFKDVVGNIFDALARGAKGFANDVITAVNFIIRAFNKLSDGVKWVGEKLGIDININAIPEVDPIKLAKGGIPPVDANGGLYSGVRAIVGEGSAVWPEYVIPTDPKYRDRARMLAQAAAERVGLFAQGGTVGKGKEDSGGGILGSIGNFVSNLPGMGMVKDAARAAAGLVFEPIKAAAMRMIESVPSDFLRGFIKKPIEMIEQWIRDSDPVIKGDRGTLEGWKGKSGSFEALIKYFESTGVAGVAGSTIRPGATTRGSGNTRASLHASARAVDFFTRPPSVDSDGLLAIYRAFLPVKDILTELIYSGPGGSNPRNPITAADHHNHVHVGLARGGALAAQQVYEFANGGRFNVPSGGGGILARIGEGFYDEEVQIKPIKGDNSGGDTMNFYGDLSFPNITDPDDAKKFIDNLKAMADT